MLMSIFSMLGGGLLRMLPELLTLWNKKEDNAHELAMLEKQFQLEGLRSENKRAEIEVQGSVDMAVALVEAQKEALRGQMQKTGIRFVDALNFLVRPITTYYFLLFYGIVKTATIVVAIQQANAWTAIIQCWSGDDASILSGILAFWFVGRVFDKK